MRKGLIHIYTGDGKGKTSAAIGLGVRAAGSGLKVLMLELSKSAGSGEQNFLKDSKNFEIITAGGAVKFLRDMTEEEKQTLTKQNTELISSAFSRTDIDVLIIDEFFFSYNYGLLDRALAERLIKNKFENLELVLTGREPPQEFVDLTDYVSEIKKIKHPFDKDVKARKGIEF